MKIDSHMISQQAQSSFTKTEKTTISIETFEARVPDSGETPFLQVSISEESYQLSKTDQTDFFQLSDKDKAKIQLIEDFVTVLTGKKFRFKYYHSSASLKEIPVSGDSSKKLPVPSSSLAVKATGFLLTSSHELHEKESMSFSSTGTIKTADGQHIVFNLNLSMSRSYVEKSEFALQIGERLQDPLVINLDGKGISFGNDMIEIDLTLDGKTDAFRMLAPGSGFLALDLNGNGTIDDGSELFGPATGSGFDELSRYDHDQNGFIDEGDELFSKLLIWTVNEHGDKTLIGLTQTDVGAIYLGKASSPYQLKEENNLIGGIRNSSIYLKESGGQGVIHEIDIKV